MSMHSWKQEFYPADASDVPVDGAPAHSLAYWLGTLPANTAKHRVRFELDLDGGPVIAAEIEHGVSAEFRFSGATSALCVHHFRPAKYYMLSCGSCPLFLATGVACPEPASAYNEVRRTGDPQPMITALQAAASWGGASE